MFLAAVSLKLVVMNILGPLPNSKSGNQQEIVLTDQHTELTRAIPIFPVTSTNTVTVFVDNLVIP